MEFYQSYRDLGAMAGGDTDTQAGTARPRAFVVDDDALSRQMMAAHVERLGFRPLEVEPEREVISSALASAGPEDILILDVILGPELDGCEVIRILGSAGFRGRLIIVSGFGQEYLDTLGSLATALSVRVAGVIAKPIGPAQLERCLAG